MNMNTQPHNDHSRAAHRLAGVAALASLVLVSCGTSPQSTSGQQPVLDEPAFIDSHGLPVASINEKRRENYTEQEMQRARHGRSIYEQPLNEHKWLPPNGSSMNRVDEIFTEDQGGFRGSAGMTMGYSR